MNEEDDTINKNDLVEELRNLAKVIKNYIDSRIDYEDSKNFSEDQNEVSALKEVYKRAESDLTDAITRRTPEEERIERAWND